MNKLKSWLDSWRIDLKRESVINGETKVRFRYIMTRIENRWVGFDILVSPHLLMINSERWNNGWIPATVNDDMGKKYNGWANLEDVKRFIPKRLG